LKFRYARHTAQLEKMTEFYVEVIELKVLGSFEKHSGYNGVFLGKENMDWYLEFTESNDPPKHNFDADDALVFYLNDKEEVDTFKKKLIATGINIYPYKNPYWNNHGVSLKDPDGHPVILAYRP